MMELSCQIQRDGSSTWHAPASDANVQSECGHKINAIRSRSSFSNGVPTNHNIDKITKVSRFSPGLGLFGTVHARSDAQDQEVPLHASTCANCNAPTANGHMSKTLRSRCLVVHRNPQIVAHPRFCMYRRRTATCPKL